MLFKQSHIRFILRLWIISLSSVWLVQLKSNTHVKRIQRWPAGLRHCIVLLKREICVVAETLLSMARVSNVRPKCRGGGVDPGCHSGTTSRGYRVLTRFGGSPDSPSSGLGRPYLTKRRNDRRHHPFQRLFPCSHWAPSSAVSFLLGEKKK